MATGVIAQTDHIEVSKQGSLGVLTLSRLKQMNALSSSFFDEIETAWLALEADPDIRVAVIRSAHEKAFIAGADIAEMRDLDAAAMAVYSRRGHEIMQMIECSRLVAIAAVNGYCLGGGFEVALSCDLIAAGPKASFAFPEIGLGLIPGFGGTQRFTRTAGMHAGLRYMLTGDRFKTDTAEQLGLIWLRVEDADAFDVAVEQAATTLAAQAPGAMAAIKRLARLATHADMQSGCDAEINAFGLNASRADAQEGLAAFLDKRKPEFKGQ